MGYSGGIGRDGDKLGCRRTMWDNEDRSGIQGEIGREGVKWDAGEQCGM